MQINIADQLDKILTDYTDDVKDITNNAINVVSKEAVRRLKEKSPKITGQYSKGWTVKKMHGRGGIVDVIIHNKTDGWKTQLLENGHVIRNQYGDYGRYSPKPHIKPVEEWANKELVREIEREL